jgi:hypothetical protein
MRQPSSTTAGRHTSKFHLPFSRYISYGRDGYQADKLWAAEWMSAPGAHFSSHSRDTVIAPLNGEVGINWKGDI